MWTRKIAAVLMAAMGLVATGRAQEVVVTGPPPELRAHLDAFIKAFNSANDADWEAMAKATFTPDFFTRQTPAERKKAHADLKAKFGTVQVQRVERNGGPDAPLQVAVKGSVASGSLWIELDDASRFDSLKGEVQKTVDPHRRH
jgi:hypothetical protein